MVAFQARSPYPVLFAALVGMVVVAAVPSEGAAPPTRTEIKSLPGLDGALSSRMWSGHIDSGKPPSYPVATEMYTFYWFVEAEVNPEKAPIVIWYQGGPGASSLFGLLVEEGPYKLNDESLQNPKYNETGIPQLVPNPYSYSKVANLLFVDNPPPVGFSFCNPAGPTGVPTSCGSWNDSYVATSQADFLQNWFKAFPEYAGRETFITGESYAGIYVPVIVRELLSRPDNGGVNLAGFAVGDGCLGTEVLCGPVGGPFYDIEFMIGHGQFAQSLYRTIRSKCSELDLKAGTLNAECKALVADMYKQIGGFYGYNLYDDCAGRHVFSHEDLLEQDGLTLSQSAAKQYWGPPSLKELSSMSRVNSKAPLLGDALNGYPCPGPAMELWLNRSDVRKAINVPVDSYFFMADNGNGFNYTLTEPNVLPFYHHVAMNTDLRVLVYNGDTDPGINSMITQDLYFEYFASVGMNQTKPWHPWTLDGTVRMGGYVTQFQGDFAYLTIRGSGHMVPEFKPAQAFAFISKWIKGEDWLPYCPTCKPATSQSQSHLHSPPLTANL